MSANFVTDLDIVDQSTVERGAQQYPAAQWLHGDPKLAAVGGVTHTGGLLIPTRHIDQNVAPPPGWTRTSVAFSSGKSEEVLACQKPRLAVIRTRFRWFVVFNGVTTYYPRSGYVANSGMRGHVQALCGISGFDFPISVAFKGKASQEFERQLREFSQKVQEAASKHMPRPASGEPRVAFPRFAFYMRLSPGPHTKVGQKGQESIITPPVLELPAAISQEYLEKIYVGRDKLVEFQDYFRASDEWVRAWERPGAEVTQAADDERAEAEMEQAAPAQQAPAPVRDVLTKDQAVAALKLHGVDMQTFKDALIEGHGAYSYNPERDTPLVRRLIAQNQTPAGDEEPF